MKRTRKTIAVALTLALIITSFNVLVVSAATGDSLISRVGNKEQSAYVGEDFELGVRAGRNVNENQIKWTIGDSNILAFEDGDRYGEDVDLIAKKVGKTTVYARNPVTNGKIVYTITVKSESNKIARVGASSVTVNKGAEFDLKVRKLGNFSDSKIKWYITDGTILAFEDGDRYGDDVELIAKKAGKTTVYAKNLNTGGKITYTVTVKSSSNKIARVGDSSRTVYKGSDFDLEVRKLGSFSDSKIKWYVTNESIVAFEDGDRYGDDVELIAKKAGKTTVYAKNLNTGGKITYTVTVKNVNADLIYRIGNTTKYVRVGDDVDLEVRKGDNVTASKIKWTIADTTVLGFEDGDNIGTEVEVYAKKAGTTKVYAKNPVTGGKISYTVVVQ